MPVNLQEEHNNLKPFVKSIFDIVMNKTFLSIVIVPRDVLKIEKELQNTS